MWYNRTLEDVKFEGICKSEIDKIIELLKILAKAERRKPRFQIYWSDSKVNDKNYLKYHCNSNTSLN